MEQCISRLNKGRLATGLMLALQSLSCSADCLGADPLTSAQNLFAKHYEFYANTHLPRTFLAVELQDLLKKNDHCEIKSEGICALDWDPWTGAQDGEMSKKKQFTMTVNEPLHAQVSINYQLVSGKESYGDKVVKLDFTRMAADQCWLLHDMIQPDGRSLADVYRTFFKSYDSSGNPIAPAKSK